MNRNRIHLLAESVRHKGVAQTAKEGFRKRWVRLLLPRPNYPERQSFDASLREADVEFQSGNFPATARELIAASGAKRAARRSSGLDRLGFRLVGAEITDSFGHLALGLMLRRKAQVLGATANNFVVVRGPRTSNPALMDYWASMFPCVVAGQRDSLAMESVLWPLVESIQWLDLDENSLHLYAAVAEIERSWEAKRFGPVLTLRDEHRARGLELLRLHGHQDGQWFAALHVRSDRGGRDYGRNADVDSYRRAVQEVRSAGGSVVALGMTAEQAAGIGAISLGVDRSENSWLDLFILGGCRFLIGTQSGPASVASAFGTPVLLTNSTGWGFFPYMEATIAIPKQIVESGPDGRRLRLDETVERGLSFVDGYMPKSIQEEAFHWVSNSPDDIAEGVVDMLDHLWSLPLSRSDVELKDLHEGLVGYPGPRLSRKSSTDLS